MKNKQKYYTGIGSRETPEDIKIFMTKIAAVLEEKGWILRSGGADGADLAFENGVKNKKEVYLPWRGFNNSTSKLYTVSDEALTLASENHPGWKYLKEPVRKLMGRNAYQVKGKDLNRLSKFLICWTPDGCESDVTRSNKTGGTGLAISIASKEGIPIFNLKNDSSYKRVEKLIKGE